MDLYEEAGGKRAVGGDSLEAVARRFARWRRGRRQPGRIPRELWEAAAAAASVHGLRETAARLQLNVQRLRQWMRAGSRRADVPPPAAARPQFVELAGLPSPATPECTLECEEPSGRKLRICLRGGATGQALQLGQMLWRGQA
jgi:hypothetical protein